ncbi:restriction system modified-DNA reader domain-containing protein [Actinoplanes regularis]|uniref:restriction system modified-DNA reader domain-containing protein n=1 Tax=Actinoplanes regularis TaxID=52697 RepID=UPI0035A22B13
MDTPNSVLRRELKIDAAPAPTPSVRTGELDPLVRAGLLHGAEELIWKRRGASHRAVVMPGGALQLADGRVFESPSGAARALAGYQGNGWRN